MDTFCDSLTPVQVGWCSLNKSCTQIELVQIESYSSTDSLPFHFKLIFNVQFKVSILSVLRQVANDLQMNSEIRQETDQ